MNDNSVANFIEDGVVLLKGLLNEDEVRLVERGIEENLANPSPFVNESSGETGTGSFFDDYVNRSRIPSIDQVCHLPSLCQAAKSLLSSERVHLFHDHVLVKECGTSKATPWHQDAPYYFADLGVSFWIPVDTVYSNTNTLRFIAGSHKWPALVLPVKWLNDANFYGDDIGDYLDVPDPDSDPDKFKVLEWDMEPGDVVAFHFKTCHGARANLGETRRRVMSIRYLSDRARYIQRPGPTSPPFPGHGMRPGDVIREDWFPFV